MMGKFLKVVLVGVGSGLLAATAMALLPDGKKLPKPEELPGTPSNPEVMN